MKLFVSLVLLLSSLPCNFSYEGEIHACVDPLFSVVLSNNTMSHEFTATEITDNATQEISMGTFTVTFNDSVVIPASNITRLSSLVFSGSTIQIDTGENQGDITYPQDTLDLAIYDDRDSSGNLNNTLLTQDSIVRQRDNGDPAIVDEVHDIEVMVQIGELTGSPSGNYRNMLYLVFEL